jgi:hypothetical protein
MKVCTSKTSLLLTSDLRSFFYLRNIYLFIKLIKWTLWFINKCCHLVTFHWLRRFKKKMFLVSDQSVYNECIAIRFQLWRTNKDNFLHTRYNKIMFELLHSKLSVNSDILLKCSNKKKSKHDFGRVITSYFFQLLSR